MPWFGQGWLLDATHCGCLLAVLSPATALTSLPRALPCHCTHPTALLPLLLSTRPYRSLWSRFFCLSVYITMYLNDHARHYFYEALGMNTTQFDRHVILETNNATERVFPEVRGLLVVAGF